MRFGWLGGVFGRPLPWWPGDSKVYGLVKGSPEAIAKLLQEKPLDMWGGCVPQKTPMISIIMIIMPYLGVQGIIRIQLWFVLKCCMPH